MDDTSAPPPESTTAPTAEPAAAAPPPVFFRAGKKKRAFRQRADETDAEPTVQTDSSATINTSNDSTATGQAATSSTEPAVSGTVATTTTTTITAAAKRDEDVKEGGGLSVAEVLRLRNAKKHRLGGVAFRAGDESSPTPQNAEQAMVLHDGAGNGGGEVQKAAILGGVAERFAPQTGMVGELVNKHMEEYIESELARRKRLAAEHRAQQEGGQNGGGSSSSNATTTGMTNLLAADPTLSMGGGKVESQRALHGKLMEIDLGEEARARNIAETERARRRLEGQILEEEEDADGRRKKVRLGPDGKPWRSRNRRDSDALKRDQQVEEFHPTHKEFRLHIRFMAGEPAKGRESIGSLALWNL